MKILTIMINALIFSLIILNLNVRAERIETIEDLRQHFIEKVVEKSSCDKVSRDEGVRRIYEDCLRKESKLSGTGAHNIKKLFDNKRETTFLSDPNYVKGTASVYFNHCFDTLNDCIPHHEIEFIYWVDDKKENIYYEYANLYKINDKWLVADFDLAVENITRLSHPALPHNYFDIPIEEYLKIFCEGKKGFVACMYKGNSRVDLKSEIKVHDKKLLYRFIEAHNMISISNIEAQCWIV